MHVVNWVLAHPDACGLLIALASPLAMLPLLFGERR